MSEEPKKNKTGRGGKGIAIAALVVGIVALLLAVAAFAATQGKNVRALEKKLGDTVATEEVQENHLSVIDFRMAQMQRDNIKMYVAMHDLAAEMASAKDQNALQQLVVQGAVGDMTGKADFLESRLTEPGQKQALAKIKELLAAMRQETE